MCVSPAHFGDHGPAWLFVAGSVQKDPGLHESFPGADPNAVSRDKSLFLGAKPEASRCPACPAESTSRAPELPGAPAPPLREVTHAWRAAPAIILL